MRAHWSKYGRNYYVRYDYEGVELGICWESAAEETHWTAAQAENMMKYMSDMAGKWPADAFNG